MSINYECAKLHCIFTLQLRSRNDWKAISRWLCCSCFRIFRTRESAPVSAASGLYCETLRLFRSAATHALRVSLFHGRATAVKPLTRALASTSGWRLASQALQLYNAQRTKLDRVTWLCPVSQRAAPILHMQHPYGLGVGLDARAILHNLSDWSRAKMIVLA